jgi:4'-phosphopantetheinyl transferase
LNTDTIQIWHGKILDEDIDCQKYWQILDAIERANAEKINNDLLRKRYIVVHARLRVFLAQALNEQPEKISIKKAEQGKPYLADHPELAFNLSHSSNAMVIAIGWNCQLGVDMEYLKPRNSLAGLVDKCFAEEENVYWSALPDTQKLTEFYRFWTRKEAFVKATGRGIALGLNHCVINPESPEIFLRVPADYGPASIWSVHDLDLGQGVCGALVTDKVIAEVRLREQA